MYSTSDEKIDLISQYMGDNTTGVFVGLGWFGGITMNNQSVSLRGTLASDFFHLMLDTESTPEEVSEYLDRLALSDDPCYLKIKEKGFLLIGKMSERGKFPPDW